MLLEEVLITQGVATRDQINELRETHGELDGRVGEHLVELGVATPEQVADAVQFIPKIPETIAETGLSLNFLVALLLKTMHVAGFELPTRLAAELKLPVSLTQELLDKARELKLVQILGLSGDSVVAEMRHVLTEQGRLQAADAFELSQYVGPCPVPLDDYCERVRGQSILSEHLTQTTLVDNTRHMILPDGYIEEIGPAVNSGRSILLYGPAGNGKTTVAEAVGKALADMVFVPHAIEVDGQVIKVYDPALHRAVPRPKPPEISVRVDSGVESEKLDERWVPCIRPTMIAGGELTLDMLDLQFNPNAKFYEAPLQMKAMNGLFIVDDFGRQRISPKDILNRWIVSLDRRIDYLSLRTGKKFVIPFDELVIFSTNLRPDDLMDEAFLRRIAYKIEVPYPTPENYVKIFELVTRDAGLPFDRGIIDYLNKNFYEKHGLPLAAYHPKFIVDRVIDRCRYLGEEVAFTEDGLQYALRNLLARATTTWGPVEVSHAVSPLSGSGGPRAA